jgi:hypothetical protein
MPPRAVARIPRLLFGGCFVAGITMVCNPKFIVFWMIVWILVIETDHLYRSHLQNTDLSIAKSDELMMRRNHIVELVFGESRGRSREDGKSGQGDLKEHGSLRLDDW